MIWAILIFMAYVYKHIRKDTNEVFYIGIGKTKNRPYETSRRNEYWKRIVNKVGHIVEIIEDGLTWEQACEMETKLIKQYGRKDLNEGSLVNMTDGGDGLYGVIFTKERNEKISKTQKGITFENRFGKEISDKLKKNLSNSNLGKKLSTETKNKMKVYHTGKVGPRLGMVTSAETKEKIRQSKLGHIKSEETKNKIRETIKLTLHNKKKNL